MHTNNARAAENQQERLGKPVHVWEVTKELGGYLAGFVDGEGSFNISLRKKSDYSCKWQPVLSFNVSQREPTLLTLLQQVLACGIVKRRKDGLHSFDVTNPSDLHGKVIPFFNKFMFLSQRKRENFSLFSQAVSLMVCKQHLRQVGLRRLMLIREKINAGAGRTRKYTFADIFPESSETIRQASPQAKKR